MRDNDKFWHLDQGVVDNAGDNVETVNDRERDEQLVERRSHLRTPENLCDFGRKDEGDDEDVSIMGVCRPTHFLVTRTNRHMMIIMRVT